MKFTQEPLQAFEEWSEEYGGVVELSFPGRTVVLVTNPGLIRQIIEVDAECFSVGQAREEAFSGMEENAMVVAREKDWRRMRNIMQRYFTPASVTEYRAEILDEVDRFIQEWTSGTEYDLYDWMGRLTIRIVARVLLGYDVRGEEEIVQRAADAVIERSDVTNPFRMVPEWFPIPQTFRFRRARRDLQVLVENLIEAKRLDNSSDTLLAGLLRANEQGELTGEELRDNVISFFLAGSDTTAAALTYTFFCLGNHPEVFEEVQSAVETLSANDALEEADDNDFLTHSIEEAMRLYPPAFSIGRKAREEYELDGYRIPAGTQLVLSQWVVQRDETIFDDPETYRPGRWKHSDDWPNYAEFPFGGGNRFCIGSHFAMMEMPIVLARIVDRLDFDVLTEEIEDFVPGATLRPNHPLGFRVNAVD